MMVLPDVWIIEGVGVGILKTLDSIFHGRSRIGDVCTVHYRKRRHSMGRGTLTDDVDDTPAANRQGVANHATMTAPWYRFGTHNADDVFRRDLHQRIER